MDCGHEVASFGGKPWGIIRNRKVTSAPIAAADPFRAHFTLPANIELTKQRVHLENGRSAR